MQATPPLMPWPRRLALTGKRLGPARLRGGDGADPRLLGALERLNALLDHPGGDTLDVGFRLDRRQPGVPLPGDDEGFRLDIAADGVAVAAQGSWGALHALTTLAQLADSDGRLPVGRVEDEPRFSWRGLMVDTVRHFVSARALNDIVDAMAFYRLNVLHLHLTDDQGFRLPSRAWPKLPSREHYTPKQLANLVRRAADRGIRVVPELDMPGHVTSWLAAYPQWAPPRRGAGDGGRVPDVPTAERSQEIRPSRRFAPHEAVLNVADDAVYAAIDALLGELAGLFPDGYVHIGGDEVNPAWWVESPEVGAYMARHELDGARALQAHFNRRVAALAAGHGKRLIGWDEVLGGGAPPEMVVQTWRGATARDRALGAGHACVESSGFYLDLFYPADLHHAWDPGAPLEALLAQEDTMLEDRRLEHVADGLKWALQWRAAADEPGPGATETRRRAGANGQRVLGGEACLWTELVDERVLPVRLWSRMPAIAERLWSAQPPHDDLGPRLEASLDRLAATGLVDVRRTSRELLKEAGVLDSQLDAVELLEPVKWYARHLGEQGLRARLEGSAMPISRPYDADTPLNRPVDALLPESFAAHRFARLLEGDGESLRGECERLLDICGAEGLLPELEEPLGKLADILTSVIGVLDGRADGAPATVAAAAAPSGEYLVAVAPAVRAWLERM